MSRTKARAALKKRLRTPLSEVDAKSYGAIAQQESDRSLAILMGSMADDHLRSAIGWRCHELNRTELKELFDLSGPGGTFSNRIKFAQAIEIIDRSTRHQLDMLRELRNVAAHAHGAFSFADEWVVDAVKYIVEEPFREDLVKAPKNEMRDIFAMSCFMLIRLILGDDTNDTSMQIRRAGLRSLVAGHGLPAGFAKSLKD